MQDEKRKIEKMYARETEIRHLSSADVYKLGQILDPSNSWKKLMESIPKENTQTNSLAFVDSRSNGVIGGGKYKNEHIRLIEAASIKQNRMATEILFDEWGTSGRKRPTLELLLQLLVKAELFRAADFVALNFLNEPPPERPTKGPAAKIDISIPMDSEEIRNVEDMLNNGSYPGTDTLNDNANSSTTMNNNKDYYEKFERINKRLEIEESDLIKFSATQSNIDIVDNIPKLSDLITDETFSNNMTSPTYADENSTVDIPILSVLQSTQPDLNESNGYESSLPDVSVLNYNEETNNGYPSPTSSTSSSSNYSNQSSLSSNLDNSAPNLSILDQRSSNNDSSLTNITETSGDNSFDISSSGSCKSIPIDDNIPCLSALK